MIQTISTQTKFEIAIVSRPRLYFTHMNFLRNTLHKYFMNCNSFSVVREYISFEVSVSEIDHVIALESAVMSVFVYKIGIRNPFRRCEFSMWLRVHLLLLTTGEMESFISTYSLCSLRTDDKKTLHFMIRSSLWGYKFTTCKIKLYSTFQSKHHTFGRKKTNHAERRRDTNDSNVASELSQRSIESPL